MIVKNVRLIRAKGEMRLQATCQVRKRGWDEIYFSLANTDHSGSMYNDASPFAAALLIPAMRQGEDLLIEGSVSERLLQGLQTIMNEVLSWKIGLKRIRVSASSLGEDQAGGRQTASFFTGGVDSFYTYLKHKHDTQQSNRVDSLIFVRGFDISLADSETWNQAVKNVAAVAQTENLNLLQVESNIRQVLEPLLCDRGAWEHPWNFIHGGCLAAVGLCLRGQYSRIYIPSTYSASDQRPRGIGPEIDKHWSSEKLTFIHDGTEATRLDKVRGQIAGSPLALKHLRVCFMNKQGAYNCGECDKCLRTMVNLYIAGMLAQAVTFPRQLDLQRIANVAPDPSEDGDIFHQENIRALQEAGHSPELLAALVSSVEKGGQLQAHPGLAHRVKTRVVRYGLRKMLYLDYAYAGGHVRTIVLRTPLGPRLF